MQPGSIAKQWSENTSQLGIKPIFPPREGFYPGDIVLLASYTPAEDSKQRSAPVEFYSIHPVYYDNLDYCRVFANHRLRPTPPETKDYILDGEAVTPWTSSEFKHSDFKCDTTHIGDFNLNESTAFPAFSFASLSTAGLGANFTSGWLEGRLGAGSDNQNYITYSVPSSEVLSVKTKHIVSLFSEYWTRENRTADASIIRALAKPQILPGKDMQSTKPVIALVHEVHYARSMDISISASQALSAQVSAATQAMIDLTEKKSKVQEEISAIEQAAVLQSQSSAENPAIEKLKSDLQDITSNIETLGKLVAPDAPGVTGQVTRSSSSGITMTQVFPKPLAIGYRAVLMELLDSQDADNVDLMLSGLAITSGGSVVVAANQAPSDTDGDQSQAVTSDHTPKIVIIGTGSETSPAGVSSIPRYSDHHYCSARK